MRITPLAPSIEPEGPLLRHEGEAMPTFVALMNWTDQGVRAYRDSPRRADSFTAAAQQRGVRVLHFLWTVGAYDVVAVLEAPDDETAAAALLQLGALGNVRTTTLRAFDADEMRHLIPTSTD
jgi:uncharacterized protein with GYD domain